MSLKAFHVLFITLSILMALWLGFWAVDDYRTGAAAWSLVLAIVAFAGSFALVAYEVRFLQKCRRDLR